MSLGASIHIRSEQTEDVEAIRRVNQLAFDEGDEADIVDALRAHCDNLISLVAVYQDRIIGHIHFSPVTIKNDHETYQGMGLAPMAVLPEFQRRDVGTLLVKLGLELCQQRGEDFVIVLGHPKYYPRFGFEPASNYGIQCQWEGVPDEAFMVRVLNHQLGEQLSGIAFYRNEFTL